MSRRFMVVVLLVCVAVAAFVIERIRLAEPMANREPGRGMRVTFLAGGSPGFVFVDRLVAGARAAADDLGVDLHVVYSHWDYQRLALDFKLAIEQRPDAICLSGHAGDEWMLPLVRDARRAGILVTSMNVDLERTRQEFADSGFGYVGERQYTSGMALAAACIDRLDVGSGDNCVVLANWDTVYSQRLQRARAVAACCTAAGATVQRLQIPRSGDLRDSQLLSGLIAGLRSQWRSLRLIVCDDAEVLVALAAAMSADALPPGAPALAGFDLSPTVLDLIDNGRVTLVNDQQTWAQGYLPVVNAVLARRFAFSGMLVENGYRIIDAQAVPGLRPLVMAGLR